MSGKSKVLPAAVIGILVAAAIIGGVTLLQQQGIVPNLGGKSTTSSVPGQTGTLAAQITDPPNVPAGVTNVYIAYSDIKVHLADAGNLSGWYTIANASSIDLMNVVNVSMTIGSAPVSAGVFNLVKFDIVSATITYNGKNYSAIVPDNTITIPIENGGVSVQAGSSAGFVIDVSPTAVPYQNGTSISWVLVPSARGLPVPQQNWHSSDARTGAEDNVTSDSWLSHSEHEMSGNLTIESVVLTNNSISVTVKNIGNSNVTLSAISVLANATSIFHQQTTNDSSTMSGNMTGMSGDSIVSTTTNSTTSTTEYHNASTTTGDHSESTTSVNETDHVSTDQQSGNYEQEFMTVAGFQVLSNGTLVQPHDGLDLPDQAVGLVIQPNQTVTLTFTGPIVTIHSEDVVSVSSSITVGQLYYVAAIGEFDTRAYANVTATA